MSSMLDDVLKIMRELRESEPWNDYDAELRITSWLDVDQVIVMLPTAGWLVSDRYMVIMSQATRNKINDQNPGLPDVVLAKMCVYHVLKRRHNGHDNPHRFMGLDLRGS